MFGTVWSDGLESSQSTLAYLILGLMSDYLHTHKKEKKKKRKKKKKEILYGIMYVFPTTKQDSLYKTLSLINHFPNTIPSLIWTLPLNVIECVGLSKTN